MMGILEISKELTYRTAISKRKDPIMKYLVIFTSIVLACCLFCGFMPSKGDFQIYENTVRLHVIANSDSEHDQNVKLIVRDRVLEELRILLSDTEEQADAIAVIEENLEYLRLVCNETLESLGEKFSAELYLKDEKYPTRHYENISLPAGVYRSLQIKIGNAEGKNWWCVLFPPLCTKVSQSNKDLTSAGISKKDNKVFTSNKYIFRFKFLELFR